MILMQVRFRCPTCKKLYVTETPSLVEDHCAFKCVDCASDFYFNRNWVKFGEIVRTYLEGQEPTVIEKQKLVVTESCPKCAAVNLKTSKECYSCGVLLDRVRGLPADPNLRATPSLVRLWEEVINNFEDPIWHDQFIKACDRANALSYAIHQLQMIIKATGGEVIAIESLRKVEALQAAKLVPKKSVGFWGAPTFRQFLVILPFAVSGFFILLGLSRPELKHLVGAGIALGSISIGLLYFIKDAIFD